MILAVKVSSAAVLPSAEVGEQTVSLGSGNPLLSGNPRPYLIRAKRIPQVGDPRSEGFCYPCLPTLVIEEVHVSAFLCFRHLWHRLGCNWMALQRQILK